MVANFLENEEQNGDEFPCQVVPLMIKSVKSQREAGEN